MSSPSSIIDMAEQLLTEKDSEYFGKIDSSKIRSAIVNVLQLLPLPCRGGGMDGDLCNLIDNLIAMEKGENTDSIQEVIGNLANRVKKVLESN